MSDSSSKINHDERRKQTSSIWSKEEDIMLLKLSQSKLKNKWKKIAKIIKTKTATQCSYRLKILSQTKIDPESPETSEQLGLKVDIGALNSDNNLDKKSQMIVTNADRKNRNLGIKLSNVTRLFGVVKKEEEQLFEENNVKKQLKFQVIKEEDEKADEKPRKEEPQAYNTFSKLFKLKSSKKDERGNSQSQISTTNNSEYYQPYQAYQPQQKSSDTEMKNSSTLYDNSQNPFIGNHHIRRSTPLDIQFRGSRASKDQNEDFMKECHRAFKDEAMTISYGDDARNSGLLLLEIENSKGITLRKTSSSGINKNIDNLKYPIIDEKHEIKEEYEKLQESSSIFDKIYEVQKYVHSEEFINLSQGNKMSKLSTILVDINLCSKSSKNVEEEQMCMELQSQILRCMIELTQNQLITDDGERLLA